MISDAILIYILNNISYVESVNREKINFKTEA
jgi:hypothetical protein